ncbi:MAG TPA: peptidoglycan DD-metalloendopeptidase family protein [Actinomycetota bacterium]|nr:peptidoglycan DD-metalloendopeptidase family protein [Actinomycetota bacterium]
MAVSFAVSFAVPATAGTKDRLDDAKAELASIQAELDEATAAWHASLTRLEATEADIADTRFRISSLEERISTIDSRLTRRAVVAFTNGPATTIDVLLASGSFTEFSDRLEFLGQVAQVDVDLVLEQEVAQEELRRERDGLLDLEQQQAQESDRLEGIQEQIDAELDQISSRVAELTAQYEKELAAQRALELLGQTPSTGVGGGGSTVVVGSGAIQVCPVAGPVSFVDSFGWPRDGHTHQGTDMISPAGTPVVAAHAGTVSHSSSSSGGLQAYVHGAGGYSFYAHLSGYSSASGSVGAGTVIGYVGSTGNAGSVNHLHFEWHPGGGSAVNPYPYLVAVC